MKIGVDVQTTLGDKTGFGFYVSNLIKNLKKIDNSNKYFLFKPNTTSDFSMPQRFYWDQIKIPNFSRKNQIDILHQPCFSVPVIKPCKTIVTIHDLIAIKFGHDIPFFSRMFFSRWMPFSYRFADQIICVSEHTKKDVMKILNIPEKKIKVIYEACDDIYNNNYNKKEIDRIKQKYNIRGEYFLHIGTLNPRKNLEFLIKVFNKTIKILKKDIKLVITGKKGWYYQGLFDLVKKTKLENSVIFTGYIEEKDKPLLYSGANLFLFPSIYEGFGLPPLEAMACGVPVISSNTSSLPEVIGDAGVLLSPKDEDKWIKSIIEITNNNTFRRSLVEKSLVRAKKFSWEKCAEETLKLYQKLYDNK